MYYDVDFNLKKYVILKMHNDKSFLSYNSFCALTNKNPSHYSSLKAFYEIPDIDGWLKNARAVINSRYGILFERTDKHEH